MDDLTAWLRAQIDDDAQAPAPSGVDHNRWLAEVDTKRRVLALYEDACERVRNPVSAESRAAARVAQFELEAVVQCVALPYADRPGYRDEWRPE